jgi:xanthine dehydrogenase accessory factor
VAFSRAVYEGEAQVEDVSAALVEDDGGMRAALARGKIALFVDPAGEIVRRYRPAGLVDAIMAKRNTGTAIGDAPVVIALGPGVTAGVDCHGVVETKRGHRLGRLLTTGSAEANTGIPGDIGGFTVERLLRAPAAGVFEALASIGDRVNKGDAVARVQVADGCAVPVIAGIDGVLRGILPSGLIVTPGMKAGDIDPRCEVSHCFTVSDKALAVAGGVLEGLLRFGLRPGPREG